MVADSVLLKRQRTTAKQMIVVQTGYFTATFKTLHIQPPLSTDNSKLKTPWRNIFYGYSGSHNMLAE
jgi:hypothetical protein